MATRLDHLEIGEVSGVQHPANELPGFLVAKSTELGRPLTTEEVSKEVDRMESDYAILYSALQACQQYMTDAPPEVTAAVDTLTQYIEGLFSDTPADGTTDPAATDPNAQPVQASADGKSLFARLMGAVGVSAPATTATEATKSASEETKEQPVSETATSTSTETATATEKSAEESSPVTKELADALSGIAEGMGALAETVKSIKETQDAHGEALSSTLDRLSAVEANRAGADITDVVISEPAQKSADRGEDALRSALVGIARRPGTSVTLGRGT